MDRITWAELIEKYPYFRIERCEFAESEVLLGRFWRYELQVLQVAVASLQFRVVRAPFKHKVSKHRLKPFDVKKLIEQHGKRCPATIGGFQNITLRNPHKEGVA